MSTYWLIAIVFAAFAVMFVFAKAGGDYDDKLEAACVERGGVPVWDGRHKLRCMNPENFK